MLPIFFLLKILSENCYNIKLLLAVLALKSKPHPFTERAGLFYLCPGPELNRHGICSQGILSPSCLPDSTTRAFMSYINYYSIQLNSSLIQILRPRADSNRRIALLQRAALPLGYVAYK